MRMLSLLLPISLALTSVGAVAQSELVDTAALKTREEQLAKAGQQWLNAYDAKDWDSLRTLYTDDAVLMAHNSKPVFGADNIVSFLKRLSDAGASVTFRFENEEAILKGDDMGFVTAKYRMDIAFPGREPTVIAGRSFLVYKWKDGGWKLWRDMDNFAPDAEPEDFE